MSTYTPDPRIQPYLDHLNRDSPIFSSSHLTLRQLCLEHGAETVETLLRSHWDTMRIIQEHR